MFIGLDVGTTNCKAIIIDEYGNFLSHASQEYPIIYPQPGYAEQDGEYVWQTIELVLKQTIHKSGLTEIMAISLSVQGDAVIPVDRNIVPLSHTILGMDYRSLSQTEKCIKIFGEDLLFQETGMPPHPLNSLTKILWLKEEHPEVYAKAWKIMTYADYILGRLGADEPTIDYTMASRTMAFSLHEREWAEGILTKTGVSAEKLSRPLPSGTIIGRMNQKLCRKLGLKNRPLLVTGGHDQTCAALGAGVTKEGSAVNSTGTAEVLSTVFKKPLLSVVMRKSFYPCYIYTKPELFFTFSLNHTGGIIYQWFRDEFCHQEQQKAKSEQKKAYSLLDEQFSSAPTGLFFFPHFNGSGTPTCNLQGKGTLLGMTLDTSRIHVAKSILEGLTFELRLNIETMEEAGINIKEIIAVGGGAKSQAWLRLKAAITNRPIKTLRNNDAACLGAAILAALGSGHFNTIDEATKECVKFSQVLEPHQETVQQYEDYYQRYNRLYKKVLALYNF